MKKRTHIIVDDELYEAVITEVGMDGAIPFARKFKLYQGGEEIDMDTLRGDVVIAIYGKLDDRVAEDWISPEEAEWRARRARFFKQ